MLARLLKYDMKSVARIWWIAAVSVLGLSVIGAFALRFLITYGNMSDMILLVIAAFVVVMASFFALAASVILTEILVFLRFYKHFFSDEGYLTFTLPVSRRTLLLSKTLNATIWMTVEAVLVVFCSFIYIIFSVPSEGSLINPDVFRVMGRLLKSLETLGGWAILYAIGIVFLVMMLQFMSTAIIQLCITIGAVIAKRLKLLAGIGIYYAFNTVVSFVGQIGLYILSMTIGLGLESVLADASFGMVQGVTLLMLLIGSLIVGSVAFLIYCITLGLLERKLNLS